MSDTPDPNSPNPSQPPIEPTPTPQPGATPPPGPSASLPPDSGDPADVEKNKVMAILAYLGILVIVPIVAAKESPFAKYHANQGLLLTGGFVVLWMALGFVWIILHFIPVLGIIAGCLSCFLFPLVGLAWLALSIMGILNVVNGKMKPLPMFPVITIIK